ncbi:MAG: chemotaxis protein CheA [Kofleriaceae bacterium]
MAVDREFVEEILIEGREMLSKLDRDFVTLEKRPGDPATLAEIFRCVHTIKGSAGFVQLFRLERLAHAGESLLSRLRDGELTVTSEMITALLGMVDGIRGMLDHLASHDDDGPEDHQALIDRLLAMASQGATAEEEAERAQIEEIAPIVAAPVVAAPVVATPVVAAPVVAAPVVATPMAAAPVAAPQVVAPAPTPAAAPVPAPSPAETAIRVDIHLLDRMMNLVGELVLARNQILQHSASLRDPNLASASQRLDQLTSELQEGVMKTRMQPIGTVWQKFPRVARDLAVACGKHVALELDGAETELDRTIIEAIKDPLTHAVRNAIDHGIEPPAVRTAAGKPAAGRLVLRAYHEGGQVNIEIIDDGAGLNLAKIRDRAVARNLVSAERAARMTDRELAHLIFHPGFSTAEQVTNLSGRGVGMDVVKTNIEKIGGVVDVTSQPGHGTTLKIKIPLTLAIIPALVVTSAGQRFAIPQVNVVELVRLDVADGAAEAPSRLESIGGATVYRLRGRLLPVVFLDQVLALGAAPPSDAIQIVVLQAGDRQFGIVVDEVNDTEEIVVKPLGKQLIGLAAFAGATIMGDGRVALILDAMGIAQRACIVDQARVQPLLEVATSHSDEPPREALLVFRTGDHGRMAVPLSLVARLEELPTRRVERAGDRAVVQYRGSLLPLIDLTAQFGHGGAADRDTLPIIVYSEHDRSVGFVVDEILDAVEEAITVRHRTHRDGVLGAAVIGGKVTDLLDVHGVIAASDPSFFA